MTRRWIFGILAVLWMSFVFWQSHLPAVKSSGESSDIVEIVQDVFFPKWDRLDHETYLELMSNLTFLVRKAAHFLEFLLLGVLIGGFVGSFEKAGYGGKLLSGAAFGVILGCLDEFHQHFVDGRVMEVFDMAVDGAGALIGVFLSLGVTAMALETRFRHGKNRPEETPTPDQHITTQ